jgi:hypothetical protein
MTLITGGNQIPLIVGVKPQEIFKLCMFVQDYNTFRHVKQSYPKYPFRGICPLWRTSTLKIHSFFLN